MTTLSLVDVSCDILYKNTINCKELFLAVILYIREYKLEGVLSSLAINSRCWWTEQYFTVQSFLTQNGYSLI
jgi:hypothetical protein